MISDMAPSSYVEYSILYPSCRSYIRHHMTITQKNNAAGRGGLDNCNKENEQKQQQENNSSLSSSTIIVDKQVNGLCYIF